MCMIITKIEQIILLNDEIIIINNINIIMKLNMLIGITETCSKRKLILIKNPTYDNYCLNIIRQHYHERNIVK